MLLCKELFSQPPENCSENHLAAVLVHCWLAVAHSVWLKQALNTSHPGHPTPPPFFQNGCQVPGRVLLLQGASLSMQTHASKQASQQAGKQANLTLPKRASKQASAPNLTQASKPSQQASKLT